MFNSKLVQVFGILAVTTLSLGLSNGGVAPTGLSQQSSFYYNTNGSYSASLLPKWCVNGHTSTASGAQNVTLMQTVGAKCARIDATNWDQVEQSLGVYTWTSSDALWNAVCAANIQPIFTATYNNTLYGAASTFTTISGSTQINGYSNYTVASLNRLVGTNGCVNPIAELFNEPNLTQWTTSTWAGSAYIGVASTVAAAAKAAQPSTTIITGGASPGTGTVPPQLWLGGAVGSSPTLTNISGYGLHPYAYNEGTPALTPLPATQLATDTLAFSQVAASGAGVTNKPIYITEYGFTLQAFGAVPASCASPSTCQTQGLYLAYAMLTAIPLFVPYFVQYDLIDDGTSYSASDQNTFGMFYNGSASSGNPVTGATPYGIKPQGVAFQSVTGCTSGATSFSLVYDTTLNVETETFNKAGGNACLAIFTWDASSIKSYNATIGTFSSVTCADVFGNVISCTYSGGTLTLSVSETVGPVIATATH